MISVFNYTDYRKFLLDLYRYHKQEDDSFTYRTFAAMLGIKSAGHLVLIIQAKANISIKLTNIVARKIKLKKRETDYFQTLVLFNQAQMQEEKKEYFEKLTSFNQASVKYVAISQYQFYECWYHAAIRAILEFYSFKDDYKKLSQMVIPAIKPSDARKSIALLEEIGLIGKDNNGYYYPADAVIGTNPDIKSVAINNFALKTIELASEAMDRFPQEERHFSWLTLGISEQTFHQLVEEFREFRLRALELARSDTAEAVYQFNFQAFPLTKRIPKKQQKESQS